MEFIATVKDGRVESDLREMMKQCVRQHEGKTIRISIKRFVRKATDNQHRFFHGPFLAKCVAMYHEVGNMELEEDDVKFLLKQQFGIKQKIRQPDGSEATALKSLSEYTTIEIEQFMERIRVHHAPFGFALPYPNEDV